MQLVKDRFDWSSGWRGDFEVEYGIDVVATNDTDYVIELVKTSSLILSADGVAVGGAGGYWYEENVYMDPGESSTFSVATSNIFRSLLGDDVENVSAHVDVTFFTKQFAVLGEFQVPQTDGGASVVSSTTEIGGIQIVGASIIREPSDDADRTITAIVGVKNPSSETIQKTEIKMVLLDRDGQQIDQSESDETIPRNASIVFQPSISEKAGRLRGATVKLTATVYTAVASDSLVVSDPCKRD